MKLRIRSLDSKETLKIEVPDSCSLQHFKEIISQRISSSSSSASSMHLSLNRKDEIQASSDAALQSLGITSGDLIFYTVDPHVFSSQTLTFPSQTPLASEIHTPENVPIHDSPPVQEQLRNSIVCETPRQNQASVIDVREGKLKASASSEPECLQSEMSGDNVKEDETLGLDSIQKEKTPNLRTQKGETLDFAATEDTDVDYGHYVVGKRFTLPLFLRKVLREEAGGDGYDHKLLIIAVHAVLLESGFVEFDSTSGMKIDRFHLLNQWPSADFSMSILYTLPDLIAPGSGVVETVVLKFQSLGKFVNIYGSLARNGSGLYRVCLDKHRFLSSISFVWRYRNSTDGMNDIEGSSSMFSVSEVFEFWKIVKDGLALPLMIDLCERTGLDPPPCLMRLPTELKLKILESLPGIDIAKMACACSEFQYLSLNNELWKQKFAEEFGDGAGPAGEQGGNQWKEMFGLSWENRKKRKRASVMVRRLQFVDRPGPFFLRRGPEPFIIGGEYDRLPVLGIPSPFGQTGGAFRQLSARRNFAPHCNLGGFDA
ncbi:F-box protein SKIP22-like [Malania oleifera]|uniref:F-box protein SKIP22-like n=1 Tax=Malania oleifera TaxID=397392 RepID=UPI0025AE9A7C|nr:F-box protein SKIP22-like [Malania oleifera]